MNIDVRIEILELLLELEFKCIDLICIDMEFIYVISRE